LKDLTPLLPAYLQERPSEPVALAHWLLASQTGPHPDAHLPCPEISGCQRYAEVGAWFAERWQAEPVTDQEHPEVTREARALVDLFYLMGSSRIDVRFLGMPMFDARLLPGGRA
jgi:hypothetical protein